jgi:hypothetical protein
MNMRKVSVLHIASQNINIGDGALIHGIRHHLKRVADRPFSIANHDIVDFTTPRGNMSLQDVDFSQHELTLVGGGGTISGSSSLVESGMAFPLSGQEIRRQRPSLAYVALGYNLFPGEELHCAEQLAEVLRACADCNIPFSVRNDNSLERLQQAVGNAADDVVEVPDPGFFVRPPDNYVVPQIVPGRPVVVVQVAGDNLSKRLGAPDPKRRRWWWPKKSQRPERVFLRQITDLVRWLIVEFGVQVVLAPHITRDLAVTRDVIDGLEAKYKRNHVRVLGVAHPQFAPHFFAAYQQADLVIGMRGHSVICATGLGTPCLAISTHDKVGGFMRKCGLEKWSVQWNDDFPSLLRQHCRELLTDPSEQHAAREQGTRDFDQRFASFMQRCWESRSLSNKNSAT